MSEGYVYILYDSINRITKIGRTGLLKRKRWMDHGRGHPIPLVIVDVLKCYDYKVIEKKVHYHFLNKKVGTEWFAISPLVAHNLIHELTNNNCKSIYSLEDMVGHSLLHKIELACFDLAKNGIQPITNNKMDEIAGDNINFKGIFEEFKKETREILHKISLHQ